jgi:hypothetical protein
VTSARRRKELPTERRGKSISRNQQTDHLPRKRRRAVKIFNRCSMNAYILLIS